nr:MOFRL family protein [Propionivibrio dicarboxylicus]
MLSKYSRRKRGRPCRRNPSPSRRQCRGANVEFLLSLCIALGGEKSVYALAGAYISPESLNRVWRTGMRPSEFLDNNDAHTFFKRLGNSIVTGPILTNVSGFRAILLM